METITNAIIVVIAAIVGVIQLGITLVVGAFTITCSLLITGFILAAQYWYFSLPIIFMCIAFS